MVFLDIWVLGLLLNMSEEQDERIKRFEHRVIGVIRNIKKDRHRAGYQNILTFLNRNEPKLEMEPLKDILSNMEEREIIINKGKRESESFFIFEKSLSEENNINDEALNNLTLFNDENLNEVLLNKIKLEVKSAVDNAVNILKGTNDC